MRLGYEDQSRLIPEQRQVSLQSYVAGELRKIRRVAESFLGISAKRHVCYQLLKLPSLSRSGDAENRRLRVPCVRAAAPLEGDDLDDDERERIEAALAVG